MTTSEIISLISSGVQAIATIALVGITFYYARQTKKTVDAMDRNSKAEFLPIIMLGIYQTRSSEKTLIVSLENVGKGLAKRPVRLTFPGVAPIFVNSISPKCISPAAEEDVVINYDIGYVLSLPEKDRKIVVEYQDIFGRNIKTEALLKETHNFGATSTERGLTWDVWTPIIP